MTRHATDMTGRRPAASLASGRSPAGASIAAEVTFRDVCHAYGAVPSLRGIDLDVAPGEVVCLLGPSGCGKSTLLRLTAGLDGVNRGAIAINRRDVSTPSLTLPPERRGIGLMFQDFALFPHLTILDNVMFGLRGIPRKDAEANARNALARVGLEAFADQYPHALSGGEQQRVALSRAIVPRPSILLMDEPFSGLDKRLRDSVREETMSVLRETRATSLLVTHDPEEAMRMGDKVVLMRNGKIVQSGSGRDLYNNPIDREAARFFSEINEIPAVIHDNMAVTPLGQFSAPGLAEGTLAMVCIRQQGIHVVINDSSASAEQPEGVAGRIVSRRFLGEVDVVQLAVDGLDQRLTARVRGLGPGEQGSDVRLFAMSEDVLVFPAA